MISRYVLVLFCSCVLLACTSTQQVKRAVSLKRAAVINVQLGLGYIAQGRMDLAKEKLDKALEQDSSLPNAHAAYGLLMSRLGKAKDAEKHFKKALKQEPHNPEFLNNYGSFLCEQNRVQDAEKYFMHALSDPLYKTPEYAYTNAGTCALKVSDYNKAEGYLRKALQSNPKFPNGLYQMALLMQSRQQYKLSKMYLDRYHEQAMQTPESLWLAIQLSRELQDRDAEASFALLLKSKFPDSKQAQTLRAKKMQ